MTTLHVDGSAILYRLFEVGYSIRLADAITRLGPDAFERTRPGRVEAQALQIANPPVSVAIGARDLALGDRTHRAELTARLYDFGVCAMRLQVDAPAGISWEEYTAFGRAADTSAAASSLMAAELETLVARLGSAVERPAVAPVIEEYVVFRANRITSGDAEPASLDAIDDAHLVPLLLGERRSLSAAARKELLPHRFSYFADDLTILTWDNALIVEPNPADHDVEYVLEFANAQLLELRVYDAMLDAELPSMYDRVLTARRRRLPLLTHGFRPVLAELQTRVADVTETVERVENSLKVTEDVYLARIYASALELFRGQTWRRGIERKLAIFRETYAMLNGEAQASRAEMLEVAIVLLILVEIIIGFTR
jgi:hypothetical protein